MTTSHPLPAVTNYQPPIGSHFAALVTVEVAERLAVRAANAMQEGRLDDAHALLAVLTDETSSRTCAAVKDQATSDHIIQAARTLLRQAKHGREARRVLCFHVVTERGSLYSVAATGGGDAMCMVQERIAREREEDRRLGCGERGDRPVHARSAGPWAEVEYGTVLRLS